MQAKTSTGSLLDLAWTADGTQLAAAGASGQVCFAQLVGLTAEVGSTRAVLADNRTIKVYNILEETTDELDFRDRVTKMCLGGQIIECANPVLHCIHVLDHRRLSLHYALCTMTLHTCTISWTCAGRGATGSLPAHWVATCPLPAPKHEAVQAVSKPQTS